MHRSRWAAAALAVALVVLMVTIAWPTPGSSRPPTAAAPSPVNGAKFHVADNSLPAECVGNPLASPACVAAAEVWTAVCALTYVFGVQSCAVSSQKAAGEAAMMSTLYGETANEINGSAAMFYEEIQALQGAQDMISQAADNAALLQLNSSTFQPALDLLQSGMMDELLVPLKQYLTIEAGFINATQQWLWANYGPGGRFAGGAYDIVLPSGSQCGGAAGCTADTSWTPSSLSNSTYVYLEGGEKVTLYCSINSDTWTNVVTGQSYAVSNSQTVSFTPSSGSVWKQSNVNAYCAALGIGLFSLPNGGTNPAGQYGGINPSSDNVQVDALYNAGMNLEICGACNLIASTNTNPHGWVGTAMSLLSKIAVNAENSAQTYWSFLRNLGYTNPNQIPSNCVIPTPADAIPPGANISGLTVNETLQLYLAWLNSLAVFYNTPYNSSTYCGGHPQWDPSKSAWGNPNINLTGFIYIPGKKVATNLSLVSTTAEQFGSRKSWTFNGSTPTWGSATGGGNSSVPIYFTAFPEAGPVHIPIGKAWEIPANDPMVVIPQGYGMYLTLRGNGTNITLAHALTSTPGSALYVTSCTVGGVPQGPNCTLEYQTITEVLPNITCPNCSGGGSFVNTPLGIPNLWNAFTNWLSGLFGGGSLGSLLGGLVSALVLLAVIALLVYVAVVEVEAWGGRKRGGGGGSSTIIVGGR